MQERVLKDTDLIVSSTDKQGIITYANKTFSDISLYSKKELYGENHNIVRHPDMPQMVFKFLWDTLDQNKSITAYVKNLAKDGKYYWVKALIFPIYKDGEFLNYTSYRKKASPFEISTISTVYKILKDHEDQYGMEKTFTFFLQFLKDRNLSYGGFIERVSNNKQIFNEKLLAIDTRQLKIDHILFRSDIQSQVDKNVDHITVTKPTCCAFGKKILSFEGEDFAKDSRFLEVKSLHEEVHIKMESYVDAGEKEQLELLEDVRKLIDEIFIHLENLIDNYQLDK